MPLEIAKHRRVLIHILKDIYKDPELATSLGFKGGTAAYLLYNLNRFSVDLDFDILDASKEDLIFEKIKYILEEYGYVKKILQKKLCLFFLLSHDNRIQDTYNIKVEINRRDLGSKYELKSHLGIPLKVMVQGDIVAHKLVAMSERKKEASRDIFDVHFFLKNNWPINKEIIVQRTSMTVKQFLQKCIDILGAKNNTGILSDVGELLDAKQKDWAKENLLSETILLLKILMESEQAD
ncbi:nucleotidyl transferase AbiEii/AbiGii toxin family protein [bacterium]|jgi:predicted nucleotidyltransferase component of viral defense system|nr:nucleotidyl transferase AbiEii/AbiGii toxin family protein [bacterium]